MKLAMCEKLVDVVHSHRQITYNTNTVKQMISEIKLK